MKKQMKADPKCCLPDSKNGIDSFAKHKEHKGEASGLSDGIESANTQA